MICAYCGKEAKGIKEHIISSEILELFPECFATIAHRLANWIMIRNQLLIDKRLGPLMEKYDKDF